MTEAVNSVTVILVARNGAAWIKQSVDAIRAFNGIENCSLIVADNASTDDLGEWAKSQDDLTYVYMDEGVCAYGLLINKIREYFNIEDNLFVMDSHFMLTPGCLPKMLSVLYEDENIGAVGAVSNSFSHNQGLNADISSFSEAVNYALGAEANESVASFGLYCNAILFKHEALDTIGKFDEELFSAFYVMKDYFLRMLDNGYRMKVCRNAVVWDILGKDFISDDMQIGYINDGRLMEEKHGMHYFNFLYNEELINKIDAKYQEEMNILEIGCDCGATLFEIKNRYPNAKVYGTDLCDSAVKVASHFVEADANNIEDENLPYEEGSFDYIIFGDVLEHLHNPQKTLKYIYKMLKKNGCVIASIPNVMHISVMQQLLHGDFTYTETGLLDKTHIHLFTYNEIVSMFHGTGYKIESIDGTIIPLDEGQDELIGKLLLLDDNAERFMYETFQYLLRARKI